MRISEVVPSFYDLAGTWRFWESLQRQESLEAKGPGSFEAACHELQPCIL